MLGYFQNTSSHNSKMFQISQKPVDATGQMKILTEVHSLLLQTMAGNLLGILLICLRVINFTPTREHGLRGN